MERKSPVSPPTVITPLQSVQPAVVSHFGPKSWSSARFQNKTVLANCRVYKAKKGRPSLIWPSKIRERAKKHMIHIYLVYKQIISVPPQVGIPVRGPLASRTLSEINAFIRMFVMNLKNNQRGCQSLSDQGYDISLSKIILDDFKE